MTKPLTLEAKSKLERISAYSLSIAIAIQDFVDGEDVAAELFSDITSDVADLKKWLDSVSPEDVDFDESE